MERKEVEKTFCEIADDLIFKMKKEIIEQATKILSNKKEELYERIDLLERALESVNKYGLTSVKFEYEGEMHGAHSILEEAKKERKFRRPYIRPRLYVLIEPEGGFLDIGRIRVYPNYNVDILKDEVIEKIKSELEDTKKEVEELKLSDVVNKEKVKELLILQEAFSKVCKI